MKKIRTLKEPNARWRRGGFPPGVWPAMAGFGLMAAVLLPGCTKDETGGDGGDPVAVEFRATVGDAAYSGARSGVDSRHPDHYLDTGITGGSPSTRTTDGGDKWATGDKVGMFMVAPGTLNPVTVGSTSAFNREYNVDPATGALTPEDNGPLYYPQADQVDFIAYYPYTSATGTGPGEINAATYHLTVAGQSSAQAQNNLDVLYAKTAGVTKSKTVPVNLGFGHVLSKVTLNITAGEGIKPSDVQAMTTADVVFKDMPLTAALVLQHGAVTAGAAGDFNPLKGTATGGADAAFTALVVPQPQDGGATSAGLPDLSGRTVTFDIAGKPLTWKIPDNMAFLAGEHYSVPITVKLTGVEVGTPTIQPWTPNPNPAGDGEARQIMPEANSYMVAPFSDPFLIPVSQANRIYGADGLGATTDGLNRVKAGNFTVELVWADSPIETGEVIEEAVADDDCIRITPGRAGNAVIGIKLNGETEYRWSWHIWVTEPVTSATDTETGLSWMDRNLGAMANSPYINDIFNNDQWAKTFGLYYQWGRKDAFPGSDASGGNQTYFTPAAPAGTTADIPTDSYTELPGMVENPLNFATNWNTYYGSINQPGNQNDSWGSATGIKTVYDPCPPGWRVPPISISGTNSWGSNGDWGSWTDKGRLFNGVSGTAGFSHFYPAGGYRNLSNGQLYYHGTNGCYWSTTASSATGGYALYFSSSSVGPASSNYRTYGFSVRCVAE
ncbi:MAG: fimbrillin family protein [Alistipes sp.]|nr:fimbrillin family protein [Alistipes sp.]